jgi:hypothetical protein
MKGGCFYPKSAQRVKGNMKALEILEKVVDNDPKVGV